MDEQRKKKLAEKLEAKAQQSEEASRQRQAAEVERQAFHSRAEDVFERIVEPAMEEMIPLLAKGSRLGQVKEQDYPPPSQTLYVAQRRWQRNWLASPRNRRETQSHASTRTFVSPLPWSLCA